MLLFFWLIMPLQVYSQQTSSISGTVTDISGEAIPGVTVVTKQAKSGAITDLNGKYTIQADRNDVLVFSFIGFKTQEVPVGNKTVIDISLEEGTALLDEVVVVGYGTLKKVNLTGAVEQISGERLENRAVKTITQALQGTVANLNISTPNGAPGTAQNINIRGYTGIQIDADGNRINLASGPLLVIDGIQGGDLSSINMNDVESISVLKDAASAAIYGSSAPYGVIIVTTKKGRTGKPTITYNNNFGFSRAINLPHYVNSLDFAEAFNEVGTNSNYTAKLFNDDVIQRIKDYQDGKMKDETIKNPGSDDWLSWNAANGNNDWFDIYFKDYSFSQQHNAGVSGGNEHSNYYVGLGYNHQDGLYNWANDLYRRYNVRANVSSELTKWLTFSFRSAFSRTQTDVPTIYGNVSGGNSYSYDYFHQIGRTYPIVPLKNPDGYYSEGSGVQLFTEGGRNKSNTDRLILTGEFVIHPLKGWDITANYSYEGAYNETTNHRKTFYIVKPSGATQARGGTSPNYIQRDMYKNQHFTTNVFSSYEKNINGHYFKALAGFTQELYDNLRMRGSNDNLYTDEVPMLSMTYGTNRSASDDASQLAIRGGFGRINYSYKDKYLLELNGRYDGTSRFMKNSRYKFYPGMSVGWVPSNESFWKPLENYIDRFKLRLSYASLGDQSFTDNYYPFYPALGNTSPTGSNWIFSGGRESQFYYPPLVNYDLTWITTSSFDFGFDLTLLNNRFNISYDWYNRFAKDFAGPGDAIPALLGTSAPLINNAETKTTGFEITLGWKDKINKVSYGVSAILGDYVGKVTKYNNPTKLLNSVWYDGMTLGEIWGYQTVGLFKDQAEIDATNQTYLNANWYPGDVHYADLNGDKKVDIGDNTANNPGDQKVIGNSTPRYSFGVNLNAEWNGFDFTAFLQGVGKRDMMFSSGANFFWGFVNAEWQSTYFTVHTDRWTQNNPNGYFPRAYFNTNKNKQPQTRYLQNAAYMRIKNVQLGYTLPKAITGKANIQKVRIFTDVENLATFTKLIKIVDPEIVNTDAKVYPLQRTWSFGINITL